MKRLLLLAAVAVGSWLACDACTSIIVGKQASTDGSVFCTYNCDSFGTFHSLYTYPAGKHEKGEMRQIFDRDTRVYHGEIPEAPETYSVIGDINEWQVTIGETTFGGRTEMVDSTGILDYGSLMAIALQRSKTAREAIKVMTSLAEEYGFNSSGETFSICDPNEAWIMEMMGCGAGSKSVVWVALRVPDDALCCHANQSRIRRFDMKDKKNVMYSKNVVSYARSQGWYSGKDEDFSFCDTYAAPDFGGRRWCDARVWAVYNRYADNFDRYLPYALGYEPLDKVEVMPLWIIPKTKLGVKDVIACLRDHYEGTPMAMNNDLGQGLYESPFRPTPLHYSIDGVDCFNERPIATMQTSFTWVSQMRNWLPREVGGVLWWANDDGDMVPYTPIYCNNTTAPHCYNTPGADAVTYSDENAYWVCNWVSNMVYPRYSLLYPELASVRDSLEASYYDLQPKIEAKAIERLKTDREGALLMLNDYSNSQAENMLQAWQELATRIIVGYNDGIKKTVDDKGHFKTSENGFRPVFTRPGYPINIGRELIRTTGDRFIVPDEKKKEPEKAEIQVCSGSIDLYKKFGSLNITPRDVMVWLPEGYKVGDDCDVLYMHDGQMLFDAASTWNHQEWQVDEVVSRLIDEGKIRKCIIVGINNTDARLDEYFPDKALQFVDKDKRKGVNVGQFKGDDYLRFIVEELKPFIDEHYKPLTSREHTMMMGSSMGGLISLYAICECPQVFGAVACLSTHLSLQLPCNGGDLDNWSAGFYDYLTYRLPKANNSIVYMDRGTEDIDIPYAPFQTRVDKLFLDEGWDSKHYLSKVFDGQGHNEKSWASRLHNPLLFLLGNK